MNIFFNSRIHANQSLLHVLFGQQQKATISRNKDYTFTVDPYSYEITVDGVDEETKMLMQNALNVGDNGKNLYK